MDGLNVVRLALLFHLCAAAGDASDMQSSSTPSVAAAGINILPQGAVLQCSILRPRCLQPYSSLCSFRAAAAARKPAAGAAAGLAQHHHQTRLASPAANTQPLFVVCLQECNSRAQRLLTLLSIHREQVRWCQELAMVQCTAPLPPVRLC